MVAKARSISRAKLSPNAVFAAATVIHRYALTTALLNSMVRRAQITALSATKDVAEMKVTVCTGAALTDPQDQCPALTGLRVDRLRGNTMRIRCESGDGLVTIDLVGKMLTFATPAM